MDEKIKISLPPSALALLNKDCLDFRVLKSNGVPNKNAFVNQLIVNYYEEFAHAEESLYDEIHKAIEFVPQRMQEQIFCDLVKTLNKRRLSDETEPNSAVLSFKPTKCSQAAILHIEKILLAGESLSSFYRRMLLSYAKRPKNEREKIVHRQNYELLTHALNKNACVCLSLVGGTVYDRLSLFSVTPAKDELFNYVLGYDGTNPVTIRLSSAQSVCVLSARASIPAKFRALLSRQAASGAQYPMYASDNKPVVVELTEKGKKMFDKIYLYRPTPVSIEGNVYTFECSANQALYYFERFGDAALILSPKKLGIAMRNYHYFAYKRYKAVYKD